MLTTINSALRSDVEEWFTAHGPFKYRVLLIGNSGTTLAYGPWRKTIGAARQDAARLRRAIAAPPDRSHVSSGDAGPAGADPRQ